MNRNSFFSYQNKLLVLLSFILGFVFFDRMALSYLVPFFEKELSLNNTQIGLLNSMLALTWAISGFIAGYWSDRSAKRKKYLLLAVTIFSIASFLSGAAASFAWLLIFRMVMGAAEGPVIPLSQAIILVNSDEKRRGFNMGFVQGFVTNVFVALAPIILVSIATKYGWRQGFYLAGIPGLILAVIGYFLIKEMPLQQDKSSIQNKKWMTLGNRNVRLSFLLGSCMMIWIFAQVTFLPKYLLVSKGLSPDEMGLVMACLGVGAIIWGIALPFLSDKFGRKPTVMIASLLSIIMPLGMICSGNTISQLIPFVIAGCPILGALPIALTIIPSESVPQAFAAQTIGLVVGIAELSGGFIAPATAGLVADKYGLPAVFNISVAAALVAVFTSLLLQETAPMILNKNVLQPANAESKA